VGSKTIYAMPELTVDRVVINLRQVAAVRMQIRLKFRSLTTGTLGSSVNVLIDNNPLALLSLLNSHALVEHYASSIYHARTSAGDAKVLSVWDKRVQSEWYLYVGSAGV